MKPVSFPDMIQSAVLAQYVGLACGEPRGRDFRGTVLVSWATALGLSPETDRLTVKILTKF